MSVPRNAPTFGNLLRAQRLAAGLTQEVLAERAGLSARTIQLLEADRARPRPDTATRLAHALMLSAPDRAELEAAVIPATRRRVSDRDVTPPARHDASTLDAAPMLSLLDAASRPALVQLPRTAPTNLPWPVSSMLGRDADLAAIRDLLAVDQHRLVTLTGVGGSGKTRLAVQVAAELLSAFADGVWFVELASTSSPELVPRVVAGALGVREVTDAPMVDTLLGFLRRKSLLLVLDNCEHLIDACAALADRLLTACPDLSILATSREPLQIAGERRWRVQPLAVPKPDDVASFDGLAGTASVRLFVERAQAIDADFTLTEANATSLGQICARLDGIPLAIELAASRIAMLAVEQIAERLDDSFQLLAGSRRAGPTRQQTMQAALGWSYDLLTPSEQITFRALSTFAGGFDLEAVQAICGTGDVGESESFDSLSRLVDKSLVVSEPVTRGRRYRLLEPVRQYAHRLLATGGEEWAARSRHAAYFAALAERAAPMLRGPEQITWLDRLEADRDNLRAALEWIAEHGEINAGLSLVVAMAPFWEARGYLSEGRNWQETMLGSARGGDASPVLQMQASIAAGKMARLWGDLANAETLLTRALVLSRDLGERRSEAEALVFLSSVHRLQDEIEIGLRLGEEGLRLAYVAADETVIAYALGSLGLALRFAGDLTRSVSMLEEGLRCHRRLGDQRFVAISLTELGISLLGAGHRDRAGPVLLEGVHELRVAGDRRNIIFGLLGLAEIFYSRGELHRAVRLLCAAEVQRESIGMRHAAYYGAKVRTLFESLRQQLSPSAFDAEYAAGEAMSLDQVLAEIVAGQ